MNLLYRIADAMLQSTGVFIIVMVVVIVALVLIGGFVFWAILSAFRDWFFDRRGR